MKPKEIIIFCLGLYLGLKNVLMEWPLDISQGNLSLEE